MEKEWIKQYARLLVVKGVHVQPGQILMIQADIDARDMVQACVKQAYLAGAKEVVVTYQDDHIMRLHYQYQDVDTLTRVRTFQVACKLDYFKEGACILHIISQIPGIFKGLDSEKIAKRQFAFSQALKEVQAYTMNSDTQWCIAAYPNLEWARQVFPDVDDAQANACLTRQIQKAVHMDDAKDPIQAWEDAEVVFAKRTKQLNDFNFASLHFQNQKGTNIHVGLAPQHIWLGGSEQSSKGVSFFANIPSEEIFTMPQYNQVQGRVYASKPLLYNGVLIKDFWLDFQDGKVVSFDALEGKETLAQLIAFDAGSAYLGEIALVPYDSPISNSNILFYNTLFDENASCHMALGQAYPTSVLGGEAMTEEQLHDAGANQSMTHVDFMFGTSDLRVCGTCKDGREVVVFEDGNFVIG